MRRRTVLSSSLAAGLAFVAGTALAWSLMGAPAGPTPSVLPPPSDDRAAGAVDGIADLRRHLGRLEQRQVELAAQGVPSAENRSGASEQPDSHLASAAPPPMTEREVADALAWHLEGQREDATWAPAATRTLTVAVTEAFPEAAVEAVDCRRTFCRLELSYADPEARQTFAREAPTVTALATQGFLLFEGDEGAPRAVLYVAREGEVLPVI